MEYPEEIYKTYKHNPPHLFKPNVKYMITGATYQKLPLIKTPVAKRCFLEVLLKGGDKYKWGVEDWVVLDNHYHIMISSNGDTRNLPKFIKSVHKFTALWIKKNILKARGVSKIFYNYWDSCITYEKSYFARLNYIYFNPVKHGYLEKAEEYKFGSYQQRFLRQREEMLRRQKNYPWDRVKVIDDF